MFMGKMMIRRDVCVNDYEICVDTSFCTLIINFGPRLQ